MIDYSDKEIKEKLESLSADTGIPPKKLIEQLEYYFRNRRYVKFVKGKYKGNVGVIFPDSEIYPYAREVYTPDGSVIWCPRYHTELKEITEEEYKEVCDG